MFTTVSSMMSKFGRDLRLPIAFIVIGFLLMFAPYVALYESGEFDTDGDYRQGFNDGVEFGYFETYLKAVQNGEVSHTIPYGYDFYPQQSPTSAEYANAYYEGRALGIERAEADIAADAAFSVPTDLMVHSDPSSVCIPLAVLGMLVFVMGSVLYMLSNTTKDWIGISLGSSGGGGSSGGSSSCSASVGSMTWVSMAGGFSSTVIRSPASLPNSDSRAAT